MYLMMSVSRISKALKSVLSHLITLQQRCTITWRHFSLPFTDMRFSAIFSFLIYAIFRTEYIFTVPGVFSGINAEIKA